MIFNLSMALMILSVVWAVTCFWLWLSMSFLRAAGIV